MAKGVKYTMQIIRCSSSFFLHNSKVSAIILPAELEVVQHITEDKPGKYKIKFMMNFSHVIISSDSSSIHYKALQTIL